MSRLACPAWQGEVEGLCWSAECLAHYPKGSQNVSWTCCGRYRLFPAFRHGPGKAAARTDEFPRHDLSRLRGGRFPHGLHERGNREVRANRREAWRSHGRGRAGDFPRAGRCRGRLARQRRPATQSGHHAGLPPGHLRRDAGGVHNRDGLEPQRPFGRRQVQGRRGGARHGPLPGGIGLLGGRP